MAAVVDIRCSWLPNSNYFFVPSNLEEIFTADLAINLLIKKENLNCLCSYYLTKNGREINNSERLVTFFNRASPIQLIMKNRTQEKMGCQLDAQLKVSPFPTVPLKIRCSGCVNGTTLIDPNRENSEFEYIDKLNELVMQPVEETFTTVGIGEHCLQIKVKKSSMSQKKDKNHYVLGMDFLKQHVFATFPDNNGFWLRNNHLVRLLPPVREAFPSTKRDEIDKPAEIGRFYQIKMKLMEKEKAQEIWRIEQEMEEKIHRLEEEICRLKEESTEIHRSEEKSSEVDAESSA